MIKDEVTINVKLRDLCRTQGIPDSEIEDKFHKDDRLRTPLSSYAIAKILIQDATGFDFASTSEFQAWSDNTKDLRNEVVHGKKYEVTKELESDEFSSTSLLSSWQYPL